MHSTPQERSFDVLHMHVLIVPEGVLRHCRRHAYHWPYSDAQFTCTQTGKGTGSALPIVITWPDSGFIWRVGCP